MGVLKDGLLSPALSSLLLRQKHYGGQGGGEGVLGRAQFATRHPDLSGSGQSRIRLQMQRRML